MNAALVLAPVEVEFLYLLPDAEGGEAAYRDMLLLGGGVEGLKFEKTRR